MRWRIASLVLLLAATACKTADQASPEAPAQKAVRSPCSRSRFPSRRWWPTSSMSAKGRLKTDFENANGQAENLSCPAVHKEVRRLRRKQL